MSLILQDGGLPTTSLCMAKRSKSLIIALNAVDITVNLEKEALIHQRNETWMRIVHIQSYELRDPVASIPGIIQMVREENYMPDKETLLLLEEETQELDDRIGNCEAGQ